VRRVSGRCGVHRHVHFTYDSVIWKLRKPAVASNFAIAQPVASNA
jgi:hypothetical protein